MDGNNAQAIEQVFAELSGGDGFVQVLVRGGDHAHINFRFLIRADRPDLALLEHAEQLHLHRQAHVSNFVQEERPAVRPSEQPLAVLVRPGEGALDVAEQLGFQKRFRKGSAIDGDERLLAAGAVFMDGAGDEFLARAGFSR